MNGKWKIYSVDMAMPPHYVGPKAKIKNSLVSEGSMICGEVKILLYSQVYALLKVQK